jgi:hypothetical protein
MMANPPHPRRIHALSRGLPAMRIAGMVRGTHPDAQEQVIRGTSDGSTARP